MAGGSAVVASAILCEAKGRPEIGRGPGSLLESNAGGPMEQSLNLLGLAPLVLMLTLALVAVGALVAGVRARSGVVSEAGGIPGWQLVLFAAVVTFLFVQVVTYALAFVF